MDIDLILSRGGFVFTTIGAIYTGIQVHKAKKIKDEIKDTRKKLYLENLLKKGHVAREESRKLGNNPSGKALRGINIDYSINEIQTFIENLLDTMHLYVNIELGATAKQVQELILKWKNEEQNDEKQKLANNIYRNLNKIIPILQKMFDE